MAADLSNLDDTVKAVSGSRVAFLLAGLKYDLNVWRELWPRIMRNAIEACKRSNARLVFFDNVYMYGKVDGVMTEEAPFRPCSKKGEIRAEIASMLLNEVKASNLTALIARSADFYGPRVQTGVPNKLVFDKFAKGAKAMCLVNDSVKHSFTFTPDAGRSLAMLADTEDAWNQTWHVPTAADPPTGKEFIGLAAAEFGMQPKYHLINRPMFRVAGLYQYEFDYVFDLTKFNNRFQFRPTSYASGIQKVAQDYRR